jgi:hypothetical protein
MTNNNKWLHTCLKRISTLTTLNGGKRRLLENAYYVCALAKSSEAYAWKTQTWRNSMNDEFRCTDDTLQHEFELSTHPSIPPNSHVGSIRWLFYILEIFADFGFQHSYYLGANRFNMRPYSYDLRLPFTTHAWSLLFGGNKLYLLYRTDVNISSYI